MKDFFKDRDIQSFAFVIAILLVVVIALAVWFICMGDPKDAIERKPDYYALATVVCSINKSDDRVTCEDSAGNLWDLYGVEEWHVGDNANLLMDGKYTASIYDDEVCGATYGAWTLTK